jgi:hypothetical protein
MMSDYAQDLGRHMDALRASESAHEMAVSAAATPEQVANAETRHWQDLDAHLSQMTLMMTDMMSCANASGTRFDTADFAGAMQNVQTECDTHRATMLSSSSLADDRAEESRHHDAMASRMESMQGHWNVMMSEGPSYTCSHCRYCGM